MDRTTGHRHNGWRRLLLGASLTALAAAFALAAPAEAGKSPFSPDGVAERAQAKRRLGDLARLQTTDGSVRFGPGDEVLATHPVMATMALDIYLHDHDSEFLQSIYEASTNYANYLLGNRDRDGDFLLEGATWAGAPADLEGVAYNALFAIELMSLSRLSIETQNPVDALFWYQGMTTVSEAVANATWDSDRGAFVPQTPLGQSPPRQAEALASMPVYLRQAVGDNIAGAVIRNHVLSRTGEETTYFDVEGARAALATGANASWTLRSALLLGELSQNGFSEQSATFAGALREEIADRIPKKREYAPTSEQALSDYFAYLIFSGDYEYLVSQWHELDMLKAVGHMYLVLDLDKRRKLDYDVNVVTAFLLHPDAASGEKVRESIRGVYMAISEMRAKADQHKLFNPRDRQQIPGFDIHHAFGRLADDVVRTLRVAESHLNDGNGLSVSANVNAGAIIKERPAPVRLRIRSTSGRIPIASVTLYRDQMRDSLTRVRDNLVLEAGGPEKEYWFDYRITQPVEGTLQPVRFSVDVRLANGSRFKYHFNHSVYVRKGLTFDVSFPRGNTIQDDVVPFDIRVLKHVAEPYVINTQFFSPAGLELREGTVLEVNLPAETQLTEATLHIHAPKNGRPGAYPYVMKLYGNGAEKGTISGTVFKHYRWLFAGPLPYKEDPLEYAYPPERGVNLRATYEGAIQPVSWMALPESAYRDGGELNFTSLLPVSSVAYLYTVLKGTRDRETTIQFASACPAVVFVNGAEVLRIPAEETGHRHSADIDITQGSNTVLIKLVSAAEKHAFFQLGTEEDITPDEISNNLWELVDGYRDFHDRSLGLVNDDNTRQLITLTFDDPSAETVSVVGSFNNWAPDNAVMRKNKEGKWELSLHLLPGRYSYRFLVNSKTQVVDPDSGILEPDGYGGQQSVLLVQ